MARLILMTAEGTQAVELRPVNSLGRHPNNTIQLLDKIVSKEHCIIEQRGDHYVLRDLGSLNGTFINNERVRGEAGLKNGDEIALGATRGRFEEVTNARPSPPGAAVPPANQAYAWPPMQGGQPAANPPAAHPPAGHAHPQGHPGQPAGQISPLAGSNQAPRRQPPPRLAPRRLGRATAIRSRGRWASQRSWAPPGMSSPAVPRLCRLLAR
jgi:adenylate cyclase